ncbi:MAG TPA: sugar-binding protein [Planctomycetota bacterium]|nr:sugar-binding protein [Planctomycetota bacterium]
MKQIGRTWAALGMAAGIMGLVAGFGCGQPATPATATPAPAASGSATQPAKPAAEAPKPATPAPAPEATKPVAPAPTPAPEPPKVVETPKPVTPAPVPAPETPKPVEPAPEGPKTVETPKPAEPGDGFPKIEAIRTFKEAPKAPSDEVLAALAKRFKVPVAVVGYTSEPPVIDGSIADKCWENVKPVTTKFLNGDEGEMKFKTEIRCLHDGTYLYVSFVAHESNMDNLQDGSTTKDTPDWSADYVQLFVRPDHKTAEGKYAGFGVFPGGGLTDHMGKAPEDEFDTKAEAKVKKNKDNWTTEIKIPLTHVGAVAGKLNAVWRGNFFRVREADGDHDGEDQGWSPTGETTTHVHEKLGVLYFVGGDELKDEE